MATVGELIRNLKAYGRLSVSEGYMTADAARNIVRTVDAADNVDDALLALEQFLEDVRSTEIVPPAKRDIARMVNYYRENGC